MGKIICIGLGPGDPELMSVKSHRLLQSATQVAYFRKRGAKGHARQIVEGLLAPNAIEHPMIYPVTVEISLESDEYAYQMRAFYDEWAARLIDMSQSEDVIVLCEGDPFFYGSYMHLYMRLKDRVEQEIIPAVTGMTASWHATGIPMTWGDNVFTVLMGTRAENDLHDHIVRSDAIAIMKTGKNLPKIAKALKNAGRLDDAYLVKYASMSNQDMIKLSDADWQDCPYFATVIVHGKRRHSW